MNHIVIEDSNEFENIIKKFEISYKKIKETFAKEKGNIESINSTDVWSGETQKVIYNKHHELQKNFEPIEEALNLYIEFMKKTLDDYKAFETKTNENILQNEQELDVNSNN